MGDILNTSETCVGCGAEGWPIHPMVMVHQGGEPDTWVSAPVCHFCWYDPAHRKAQLKGHFFYRKDRDVAVENAGSSELGMGADGRR